jgi:chromosome segregation ATPase
VLDDRLQTSESEEPLHDVELRKSATETLGGELYVLALASNGTLPEPQPSVVLSSAAEIASLAEGWQQLDRERRELARRTIQAEGAAEEARRETAELGRQLVRIETELARARQAIARHDDELTEERAIRGEVTTRLEETERQLQRQVEQLNRTIREMQETRAWRVGSTFWRWRDRLLRRRAS